MIVNKNSVSSYMKASKSYFILIVAVNSYLRSIAADIHYQGEMFLDKDPGSVFYTYSKTKYI
jgi:hypothetical protein